MPETTAGLVLLVIAGAMNGSFTLPMKFARRWAWENTWLAYTIFALFVFPPVVTLLTVPNLRETYAATGYSLVLIVAAFGGGWGISQVFFGLAVDAIGIALAFSVILGISAAVGSLVPLIRFHSELVFTATGAGVLGGVAIVIAGVVIFAQAGRKREAALGRGAAGRPSLGRGLLFATLSGLGSALINLGLAFGGPLLRAAERSGASPALAPNAIWLPLMVTGGIPNLLYCAHLLRKNGNWNRFRIAESGSYWWLAGMMAIFWFGSTLLYGVSTRKLGSLGVVLGWPSFMSLIVITACLWGVATGEWKAAGKQPLRLMWVGVATLVLAVFVLAMTGRSLGA
jgi:L-rhamnose-H+ transport protein